MTVTTLEEKTVTARKRHSCGYCLRHIEVGERHFTQRNADGREVWTFRAHELCHRLIPEFWEWYGYEPHLLYDDDWMPTDDEFRAFLAERTDR